jgi:uncharacterized protein (DUF305 family)
MALLSRAFIRKRMISLAATASVTATSFALADDPTRTDHPRGATPIQHVADRPDRSEEHPFLSGNAAAMKEMMADITIEPTSEVNRDFVAMMVPPPQGAIDMAKAELKYGHNEQLRRLAAGDQGDAGRRGGRKDIGGTIAGPTPRADGVNVYR